MWDYDGLIRKLNSDEFVNAILLTHCHQDHILELSKLLSLYPNIKIFCSQSTFEGLKNEEQNMSYILPEYPFQFTNYENVNVIEPGKNIIDGLEVEVLSTHGHSEDYMTCIIKKCIFTGDSYIPFSKVFAKWPRSNKMLAKENENKLISLIKERNLIMFPGHWE